MPDAINLNNITNILFLYSSLGTESIVSVVWNWNKSYSFSAWLKDFSCNEWTFPATHDDLCMCRLCGGPRAVCVHVCQWGEADQGEGVTVALWTMAREQYVGQGLALANLSGLEPWLHGRAGFLHAWSMAPDKNERGEKTAAWMGGGERTS